MATEIYIGGMGRGKAPVGCCYRSLCFMLLFFHYHSQCHFFLASSSVSLPLFVSFLLALHSHW